MFTGTHLLLYSADPAADRAFLRDVLGFKYVDTGHDWLIFQLPPAEAGVHPLEGPNMPPAAAGQADGAAESTAAGQEPVLPPFATATVWLMCSDIVATMGVLAELGVSVMPPQDEGWGIATSFPLPSGARLGLYQPRHEVAVGL
jgi:catechol 2,3-dioxygenase-like lactoylglutathione lyase family enzyme